MASKDTRLNIIIDAQNKSAAGFASLKGQLDSARHSVDGISSAMKGIGAAGTVAFGGLAFMTKGIIAAGAGFEQTNIAFETMLGSAEVAKKTLGELASFAAKTPFELPQLEEASKRLLAYGTSAEDLIPTLEMLGDISAGVGMDKLPQLILAFGQVKAATKLTGSELRQFSEAGVPMIEALVKHFNGLGRTVTTVTNAAGLNEKQIAKLGAANASAETKLAGLNIQLEKQMNRMKEMQKNDKDSGATWKNLKIDIEETKRKIQETTGVIASNNATLGLAAQQITTVGEAAKVTAEDIFKMASDGVISFDDVNAALAGLTAEGGKFSDLMDKQSQSLSGQWSNLKDQISLTARAMGTELLPYLKPIVEKMIAFAQTVQQFVKDNPQLAMNILLGALALSGLLAVLLPLAIALPGIVLGFQGLAFAFGLVTAMSAPVLLAVGAIVTILGLLWKEGYFTAEAWKMVWLGIKTYATEGANAVISVVESMVNWVLKQVNRAISAINTVISAAKKIPGVGSKVKSISLLDDVSFNRLDAPTAFSPSLMSTPSNSSLLPPSTNITVTGNTFLDQFGAEKVGDLILYKLKLSSQI